MKPWIIVKIYFLWIYVFFLFIFFRQLPRGTSKLQFSFVWRHLASVLGSVAFLIWHISLFFRSKIFSITVCIVPLENFVLSKFLPSIITNLGLGSLRYIPYSWRPLSPVHYLGCCCLAWDQGTDQLGKPNQLGYITRQKSDESKVLFQEIAALFQSKKIWHQMRKKLNPW